MNTLIIKAKAKFLLQGFAVLTEESFMKAWLNEFKRPFPQTNTSIQPHWNYIAGNTNWPPIQDSEGVMKKYEKYI